METSIKTAVVVTSGSGDLAELGKIIAERLGELGVVASCRAAADTSISHLAPAELLIFGSPDEENPAKGDFRELARAFKGVNLAGRFGAFFTLGSGRVFKAFSAMLKDTDLTILEPGLSLSAEARQARKTDVSAWLSNIMSHLQGAGRI